MLKTAILLRYSTVFSHKFERDLTPFYNGIVVKLRNQISSYAKQRNFEEATLLEASFACLTGNFSRKRQLEVFSRTNQQEGSRDYSEFANLKSMDYDDGGLLVAYYSGSVYRYFGVPSEKFTCLLKRQFAGRLSPSAYQGTLSLSSNPVN